MEQNSLPTIRQILEKADSMGSVPLTDEESRQWFEDTVSSNRAAWACLEGEE